MARRRETEFQRECVAKRWPYYAAAFGSLAAAAIAVVLFAAGGSHPGRPLNPFTVPRRAAADRGPLGNIVRGTNPLSPQLAPSPGASTTVIPVPSASAPATTPVPSGSATDTPAPQTSTPTPTSTSSP